MRKENSLRTLIYISTVIAFIMDMIFYSALRNYEEEVSIKLQSIGYHTPTEVFTYPVFLTIFGAYFLLYYNIEPYRPRFYYEILWTAVGVGLNPAIKLIAAQVRPFMYTSKKVLPVNCECDYGMPSGHAMLAAILSVLIYKRFDEYLSPE